MDEGSSLAPAGSPRCLRHGTARPTACARPSGPRVWAVALALLGSGAACAAEVYKWVDANGVTHFSQTDRTGGQTRAQQVQVRATTPPSPSAPATVARQAEQWPGDAPSMAPASAPSGRAAHAPRAKGSPAYQPHAPETDAQKCRLARGVLSGRLSHTNGAPTDAYDRQVAENDVRAYCGK